MGQEDLLTDVAEPRLFFTNYTDGLLAINTTLLAVAVGIAAVLGAVVLVVSFLESPPTNNQQYQYQSRGFRASGGSSFDILTLLSVASDIYGKLNYEDVDCQKKIICEFMKEPEMFGSGATRVKSGVQMASKFLEAWGGPYVAQLTEAAQIRQQGSESCEEKYRSCVDISLKDSYTASAEKVKGVFIEPTTTAQPSLEEEYEYEYYDRK